MTGLSNHRHACNDWKNYDAVTVSMSKRRRLEQEEHPETGGPVQDANGESSTEVFHLHISRA